MTDLCTHINVGFFGINDDYQIENSTDKLHALKQISLLKNKNKSLKILISVGGAKFQGFSLMTSKHSSRKLFIKSVIALFKKLDVDGIDLDWEWPGLNGNFKEKINFLKLLFEFREAFKKHSKYYILSADVSSSKQISELAYFIPYIAKYIDFVNVMCYDYHFFSKWYPFTGHNSALYSSKNSVSPFFFNVNYSINYWISESMPKEKIVLGVPTFGHSYKLLSQENVHLHAPAIGNGELGNDGFVFYSEICHFTKEINVSIVFDNISKVPYAYKFPNWISYEDETSVTHKANYAIENKLGGIMIYSINSDDYLGLCTKNGLTLPLTRKINSILFN